MKNKVEVRIVRAVDLDLAPGVQPDMTKHGFKHDDWPTLRKKVMAADILVLCTPIWLGEESSVCRRVIERLYGESGKLNDKGQYIYYGRVGGCLITGNEDYLHGLEPDAPGAHAQGRRRHPRTRQPARQVGCGLSFRPSQP